MTDNEIKRRKAICDAAGVDEIGKLSDGDWMINTGDGIYSIIGYNEEKPIAWMPLPEPYKEETE